MKYLLVLSLVTLAINASGASVTVAWDANVELEVDGYKVHVGTNSGKYYTNYIIWGRTNTTATVSNLGKSQYFFVVTAFDTNATVTVIGSTNFYGTNWMESLFSNEVSYAPPFTPMPPKNFRGIRVILQDASLPSGPWNDISGFNTPQNAIAEQRFYRAKLQIWQ